MVLALLYDQVALAVRIWAGVRWRIARVFRHLGDVALITNNYALGINWEHARRIWMIYFEFLFSQKLFRLNIYAYQYI